MPISLRTVGDKLAATERAGLMKGVGEASPAENRTMRWGDGKP